MATWRDVIEGAERASCEAADVLEFVPALPDDSVDLLVTSPPYLKARTYGRDDVARGLDEWVAWMVRVVTAASPKVKGLIAINCEGQTKDYRYHPSPFVFMAELHRLGFNLRKPPVYQRNGIMGSGGPDWLRNDWEPVVCVTRPGRLPWSCPTAFGKPPKYGPGGVPSHRQSDGTRVNRQRVKEMVATGVSQREAARRVGLEFKTTTSGTDDAGTVSVKTYVPPEITNPGNVIKCSVGGGKMGHKLAHENEAPFPLKLAEFFVASFCPPGGLVLDCFSGSGTTAHAAILHGRRFVGCDLRESQSALTLRRLRTVTPNLVPA